MSHEILYTSAPKLLKAGVSGYGTVISTRGISSHLAEKLEGLSGYRWAFEQGDPQARLNPVCFSHVIITVAGQRYHVLSRVSDYGADYSGRSNKIAHHVALSDTELTPGGPAWLLKSTGFCESTWDQQTRVIETGRQPTRSVRSSADYSSWKRATGDAGWAGVLAETALPKERRPVHVIFPLGMDTLSLVEEALNLLPHRERWKVSFSTYYNSLPASIDCLWRFVLDGTPEAANLRRQPHQTIIDLCSKLGLPTGGELIERAREGWQPTLATSSATPTRLPSKDSPGATRPFAPSGPTMARSESSFTQQYRIDADVPDSIAPVYVPPVPSRYQATNTGTQTEASIGYRLPIWGTVIVCLLVAVASGVGGFKLGRQSIVPPKDDDQASTDTNSIREEKVAPAPVLPDSTASNKSPSNKLEADNGKSGQDRSDPTEEASGSLTSTKSEGKAKDDVRAESEVMSTVPKLSEKKDSSKESNGIELQLPSDWSNLSHYYPVSDNVQDFKPFVYGATALLGDSKDFPLKRNAKGEWEVLSSDGESPLAIFRWESNRVELKWQNASNRDDYYIFRKCLIQLEPTSKPVPLSSVSQIPAPSLLEAEADKTVNLAEELNLQALPLITFIGKWRLNNIDSAEFSLDASQDSVSAAALGPDFIELRILDSEKSHIATVKVQMKRQKLPKDKSVLSEVGFQLFAEMPLVAEMPTEGVDKKDEKVWNQRVRDGKSKENEKYTLEKMLADKTRFESGVKNAGLAKEILGERWKEDGTVAKDVKGDSKDDARVKALYESSKAFDKENLYTAIVNLVKNKDSTLSEVNRSILLEGINELENKSNEKLKLANRQIAWRQKMDVLTSLLKANGTLSATIWYECLVENQKTKTVVLAEVTTTSSKGDTSTELKTDDEEQ